MSRSDEIGIRPPYYAKKSRRQDAQEKPDFMVKNIINRAIALDMVLTQEGGGRLKTQMEWRNESWGSERADTPNFKPILPLDNPNSLAANQEQRFITEHQPKPQHQKNKAAV